MSPSVKPETLNSELIQLSVVFDRLFALTECPVGDKLQCFRLQTG